MDFALTEEQEALRDLARGMGKELEGADAQWAALAQAEVLGLTLPEDVGGAGLGMVELAVVLEGLGRTAAPAATDLVDSLVLGAMPLARFGDDATKSQALPGFLAGSSLVTGAWEGLDSVPLGERATGGVVIDAGDEALFCGAPRWQAQQTTDDRTAGALSYDAADAVRLGGPEVRAWTLDRAWVAQSALLLGLADGALRLTSRYATERQQFGRPIATFQAVTQRVADMYVDVLTLRLAVRRAAWALDAGHVPADRVAADIATARFVAADACHRVVCAAQHVHGGVGFDREYPLHRHFLMAKRIEFSLGGASEHLARLGELIL